MSIWAKIDVDIFHDPKWHVIQRTIKDEIGKVYRPTDICTLFIAYCLASKKKQKAIDVRTLSLDIQLLIYNQVFESKEDIDLINKYFITMGLLTRRFTVTKYYDWNENDKFTKLQSDLQSYKVKSTKLQSNLQSDLQSSLQSDLQSIQIWKTPEYNRLQNLKRKAKKEVLSQENLDEIEVLQKYINDNSQKKNKNLQSNLQSDLQSSQNLQSDLQSSKSSAIEIELENRARDKVNNISISEKANFSNFAKTENNLTSSFEQVTREQGVRNIESVKIEQQALTDIQVTPTSPLKAKIEAFERKDDVVECNDIGLTQKDYINQLTGLLGEVFFEFGSDVEQDFIAKAFYDNAVEIQDLLPILQDCRSRLNDKNAKIRYIAGNKCGAITSAISRFKENQNILKNESFKIKPKQYVRNGKNWSNNSKTNVPTRYASTTGVFGETKQHICEDDGLY